MTCPGGLALCGVPCGCEGRNPSHYRIMPTATASALPTLHTRGYAYLPRTPMARTPDGLGTCRACTHAAGHPYCTRDNGCMREQGD